MLFIATKSPVDISSFIELIHTNQLFSVVNKRPDELGQFFSSQIVWLLFKTDKYQNAEREILFVWVALTPVVGNPIIYLFCVTEYRSDLEAPNITSITLNLIKSVPNILTINNLLQFQKQHQEGLESMYRWERDISFTSTA